MVAHQDMMYYKRFIRHSEDATEQIPFGGGTSEHEMGGAYNGKDLSGFPYAFCHIPTMNLLHLVIFLNTRSHHTKTPH